MSVSEKNTKKEILEELKRVNDLLIAERNSKKTISQVQQEKVIETKQVNAEKLIKKDILAPEIMQQYQDLIDTIKLKREELSNIEEMEQVIIDVEALLITKDTLIKQKESEYKQLEEQYKINTEILETERKQKLNSLDEEYNLYKSELEKKRKREAEDFAYNLDRERQKEKNQYDDKKEAFYKQLEIEKQNLDIRALEITKQEEEIQVLKARVSNIDNEIKEQVDSITENLKKKFEQEKHIAINAINKDAEWKEKLANLEKERAVEDLAKANLKIQELETKLADAYNSMTTLATTTVQSNGGVKILDTTKEK